MVLLAAEHWLVGSDKYRLQHSQMNIVVCSSQYGEKGREVVSLRQCEQALRVCFQVSGYSWIRLVECQWVFRSRIVITCTRVVIRVNCVILSRCVNCNQLRSSARLRVIAPCSRRNWAIMAQGLHVIITGDDDGDRSSSSSSIVTLSPCTRLMSNGAKSFTDNPNLCGV